MKIGDEIIVSMHSVNKWFGQFHVLRDIHLTVNKGAHCHLRAFGFRQIYPIRCLNRLEVFQEGEVDVLGIALNSDLKNIEFIRREVGMVFQHFNLFPHLTILENCTLAPVWVRKTRKGS